MNFMEAVKAMSEGKKVRRNNWGNSDFCLDSNNSVNGISYEFGIYDFEATDWELFNEERNWSLADLKSRRRINENDHEPYYNAGYVKKCRDLILDDLTSLNGNIPKEIDGNTVHSVINKRFGNLR